MTNLIKTIFIGLLLLSTNISIAQKKSADRPLLFDTESWNFGEIEEVGGRVSHTFIYINNSDKPMIPEIVRSSCGCTTVSYDHKPVMAGKSGEITVYFDPTNLPGQFHKTVSFITNNGKTEYTLKIDGVVKPRKKGIDEQYPYLIANGLQISSLKANFGYARHGKTLTKIVDMINTSDKELKIDISSGDKSGILKFEYPKSLKAKAKGELRITCLVPNARYGTFGDVVTFIVNGQKGAKTISVSGIAVENATASATSPDFRYEPSIVDFGTSGLKSHYTKKIKLINNGKQPLIIRAIECNGGASVGVQKGQIIKAGGTLETTITLTPARNAKGKVSGSVAFITNDPERPMREIRCMVTVK